MFYRTHNILRTLLLLIIVPKDAASHRFTSFAEIKNWLQNWIASKDESFFRDEIRKLPERWEKIVGSDGQYFNWFVHSFCFEINPFLNIKKRTELICTPNIIKCILIKSISDYNIIRDTATMFYIIRLYYRII